MTSKQGFPLTIVTRRDIFQRVSKEKGLKEEYQELSAQVWLSPADMKALGIEEGARVRLRNEVGAIVVKANSDSGCPQEIAFMPISPYSSRLISYDPDKRRLPNFKQIEVLAEPTEEDITPIS